MVPFHYRLHPDARFFCPVKAVASPSKVPGQLKGGVGDGRTSGWTATGCGPTVIQPPPPPPRAPELYSGEEKIVGMLAKKRSAQNTVSLVLLARASWQYGRAAKSGSSTYPAHTFNFLLSCSFRCGLLFNYVSLRGTSLPLSLRLIDRKRLRSRRPREECESEARSTFLSARGDGGIVVKKDRKARTRTVESTPTTIWIGKGAGKCWQKISHELFRQI